MPTIQDLLMQHSTNPVDDTENSTNHVKDWAKNFLPIKKVEVRTYEGEDNWIYADFDEAFLPLSEDDKARLAHLGNPPNYRQYRFESETDHSIWWHTEVSNIVITAFHSQPAVVQQAEVKPFTDERVVETVDIVYSMRPFSTRFALAIGEMKRGGIKELEWMSGKITSPRQQNLSRELRG
jgi:hypothetical protein